MSVFRFAPSPNGKLHLGHAFSALLNAQLASQIGGRLLLRIEDIDTARCTPEFEAGIYRDLDWLGIAWEQPVRRQSEHFGAYGEALDRLIRDELAYPAFMSRSEIRAHIAAIEDRGHPWPRDPDGVPHYPAVDKALTPAERQQRVATDLPFAWRLDMARAVKKAGSALVWTELSSGNPATIIADPARWGDVILARKDTPTSYNLSVVLDDALQGISHVVRGQDLYEATSVHRLLQTLLGLPTPLYHHHRLIAGPDGRKLSKSEKSTGLRALRDAGATPQEIRTLLGFTQAS